MGRGSVDDQHEEKRTEAVAAAVGPINDIGARPASRRMSTRGQAVGGRTAATPLAADVSPVQQQAELPGEALGLMEAVWDLVTLLSALPEAKGPLRPPRLSRVHFAIEGSRQARLSRHQQVGRRTRSNGMMQPAAVLLTSLACGCPLPLVCVCAAVLGPDHPHPMAAPRGQPAPTRHQPGRARRAHRRRHRHAQRCQGEEVHAGSIRSSCQ